MGIQDSNKQNQQDTPQLSYRNIAKQLSLSKGSVFRIMQILNERQTPTMIPLSDIAMTSSEHHLDEDSSTHIAEQAGSSNFDLSNLNKVEDSLKDSIKDSQIVYNENEKDK